MGGGVVPSCVQLSSFQSEAQSVAQMEAFEIQRLQGQSVSHYEAPAAAGLVTLARPMALLGAII